MTCECDVTTFPPDLVIVPGLEDLPRQIAGFPEFRTAMLALIPTKPALANWRGRDEQDFGLMLLEMWAYVCDVVSFYDKVIADEAYLRTAKLRPSVRKLISLLGYLPRPAVSATVRLSLLADAKAPVLIPAGTGLRSGSFAGGSPQVFLLDADTTIYPNANSWKVAPPQPPTLSGSVASLYLVAATSRVVEEDLLYLELGDLVFVRTVTAVTKITDGDGRALIEIAFDTPIELTTPVLMADVTLHKPTRSSDLRPWNTSVNQDPVVGGPTSPMFGLEGLQRGIKDGHRLIITDGTQLVGATVADVQEPPHIIRAGSTFTVDGKDITTPDVTVVSSDLYTKVTTGTSPWGVGDAHNLTVWFHMAIAGHVTTQALPALEATDPIVMRKIKAGSEVPPVHDFQFVDAEGRGVDVTGTLDFTSGAFSRSSDPWTPALVLPVTAYGNVARATRGEQVTYEVLGSGDGSSSNQAFTLKKSPLSYVAAPASNNASGVASTLSVWVDSIMWAEVPSFYGQPADARVYIVRQTDDGSSVVTFGNGVNGSRLTTGSANVLASYRFGAGEAHPPAGSITKIATAVTGLRGVVNPIAAGGGADAETAASIRATAPRSALLLGRAVSIDDMQAAAASAPGVIAAAAEWRWDGTRQAPVVMVWYLGDADAMEIAAGLRALSDPSTPISVAAAQAVRPVLAIDVETDPTYIAADVVAAVLATLLDKETGLLPNTRIGIGQPVFRSAVFAAVLAIPGALAVRGLQWDGAAFTEYGKTPGAGYYFDFEAGNLQVSGGAS